MENKLKEFIALAELFHSHGFSLYLVGGTVRDYLLGLGLTDMDVVTDATPDEMRFFIDGDYTFSKMGSVRFKFNGIKFDITTLREERSYSDHRHPDNIVFVKDIEKDHYRRDFTVNAMYMDEKLKIYDFENGLSDLKNRIIRMVGDPQKRLEEDPLRILRCLRFSLTYDFKVEENLEKCLIQSAKMLDSISKDKIKSELLKMKEIDKEKIMKCFDKYSIKHLYDVIK